MLHTLFVFITLTKEVSFYENLHTKWARSKATFCKFWGISDVNWLSYYILNSFWTDGRTNRRTDRQTDWWTDRPTWWHIELLSQLTICNTCKTIWLLKKYVYHKVLQTICLKISDLKLVSYFLSVKHWRKITKFIRRKKREEVKTTFYVQTKIKQ